MAGDIVFAVEADPARPGGYLLKLGTSRHEFTEPDSETFGASSPYRGPGVLIDRWIEQLGTLTPGGGTVLLPYNFSDQCTGWLRAGSADGVTIEVQAGWSGLSQYAFAAEDFAAAGAALTDFAPIRNARISGPAAGIIDALRASRDAYRRAG